MIKQLRSLDRKKSRNDSGLFICEGARLVEEGLKHNWEPVFALAASDALDRPHSRQLLADCKERGARVVTTTQKVLTAVSRKDNPQTIIAAFRQKHADLSTFPTTDSRRWIALYHVRDPGNLGTILRTADSAGLAGVILIGECCDRFSPEAVRATMGSTFSVPLAHATPDEFLDWATNANARIVAASMRGTSRHHATDFGDKSVILMGNEQSGLPPELEDRCDALVQIPMSGGADSLNLACASALMIYEVWRSRDFDGARN